MKGNDPTSPYPPSENLKQEIIWTETNFRAVAFADKQKWASITMWGQRIAISFGVIPAVIIAVWGPLPKSFIEVVVIVLPLIGSTASAVLLQTRAVTRQRDYELAWQAYDHLMSQIDLMIADVKGKGLSPQAVEAECTRIAQVLIDERNRIENSLIKTTTTPQ
jgi:hypothetical protein